MGAVRHHATTLIAGLVVLGMLGLVGVGVASHVDLDPFVRGIIWFVGAFLGAHVARRMLRTDAPSVCVAAALMIVVAVGIRYRLDGTPLDATLLVILGLTIAGALVGALTARQRAGRVFAVVGAGAAGLGAAMLGIGVALLVGTDAIVLSALLAIPFGAFVTTRFTNLEALDAALGIALVFGGGTVVISLGGNVGLGLLGGFMAAVLGWLLGGIGGAIGVKLRPEPHPDLPEARQL